MIKDDEIRIWASGLDETGIGCTVGFVVVLLKSKDQFVERLFRVNNTITSLLWDEPSQLIFFTLSMV